MHREVNLIKASYIKIKNFVFEEKIFFNPQLKMGFIVVDNQAIITKMLTTINIGEKITINNTEYELMGMSLAKSENSLKFKVELWH